MPKVTFVNEHRTVEVEAGRTVSDIAAQLGIPVCREEFAGTGLGNYTIWVKGPEGCVSPPGFWEKLQGARGWKRLANRARVLGDVEIFTQSALGDRLRAPRPVSDPPAPKTDTTAPRKPIDASGSAAFPYGDPRAVGKGGAPAGNLAACCAALQQNANSAPLDQKPYYIAAAQYCNGAKNTPAGQQAFGNIRSFLQGAKMPAACK